MAWKQVGYKTVAGAPATWGSAPPIAVSANIVTYRDDVTNAARIGVSFVVGAVSGGSSFGYSILGYAWVISDANLKGVTIKNNSPSQWTDTLWSWLEWEIGDYDPNTPITVAVQFQSNSGRSAISFGDTVTIPRLATESGHVYVGAGGAWKKAVPYVGVNGAWKKAAAHIGVNGTWKKTE